MKGRIVRLFASYRFWLGVAVMILATLLALPWNVVVFAIGVFVIIG